MYIAVVRGWLEADGEIDYPLANDGKVEKKNALTRFQVLDKAELDIPVDRYPTSRYSLVKAVPETGRWRQIRRHFDHIRHPILGDKKHGDRHHNRMWTEKYQMENMLLHARGLYFQHPFTREELSLKADYPEHWLKVASTLDLKLN